MTTPAPAGTLVTLNPAEIAIDPAKNIRKDLKITAAWVKNLKQHGVRTPISVYWDPTLEHYQVVEGNRRVAGAVKADLTEVRALVIDPPEAENARIVDQVVENLQREALTPLEEATAYRELALFGMSAMEIAGKTNSKMGAVGDALKVTKSTAATTALSSYQITVDDALVFAEFDHDQEAIATLTTTVAERPEQLAHTAARLREARDDAAARQKLLDDLNLDDAVTHLQEYPQWPWVSLDNVFTDAEKTTHPTHDQVQADHLGIRVLKYHVGYDDAGRSKYELKATFAINNPESLGYSIRDYVKPGKAKGAGLTDEQRAQRKQARENTKAWGPATNTRIAWVKKLLERRSLPQDAPALAALWVSQMTTATSTDRAARIAHDLLGLKQPKAGYYSERSAELTKYVLESANQGVHVLIAVTAGSIEACLDEKKGWEGDQRGLLPLYLKQLSAWGYTLSDIEESIVQKHELAESKKAKRAKDAA